MWWEALPEEIRSRIRKNKYAYMVFRELADRECASTRVVFAHGKPVELGPEGRVFDTWKLPKELDMCRNAFKGAVRYLNAAGAFEYFDPAPEGHVVRFWKPKACGSSRDPGAPDAPLLPVTDLPKVRGNSEGSRAAAPPPPAPAVLPGITASSRDTTPPIAVLAWNRLRYRYLPSTPTKLTDETLRRAREWSRRLPTLRAWIPVFRQLNRDLLYTRRKVGSHGTLFDMHFGTLMSDGFVERLLEKDTRWRAARRRGQRHTSCSTPPLPGIVQPASLHNKSRSLVGANVRQSPPLGRGISSITQGYQLEFDEAQIGPKTGLVALSDAGCQTTATPEIREFIRETHARLAAEDFAWCRGERRGA